MTRRSWLLMTVAGLSLASVSRATPAPEPKPREARLEVKPLPGQTEKEQEATRKEVLERFTRAVQEWVLDPATKLPGLDATASSAERIGWMSANLKMTYVGKTGVVRISCLAGTSQEAAAVVNAAAKTCVSWHECLKTVYRLELGMEESLLAKIDPASNDAGHLRTRNEAQARAVHLRQGLASLPEVAVLKLAPVPAKK